MENYIKINEANKTKIVCKKEIIENLRTNENLRNYIIHCTNSIFKDKEIFNKQKIIAIKNLVKDIKLVLKNILHPQSHSDITKPLYKKELEEAIKLMEEFNNILRVQNEAIITRV